MDKYQHSDTGYKTDYEDGLYEVVHIAYSDESLEKQHKHSRIVEIKNGYVVFPKTDEREWKFCYEISQYSFFEVNIVLDYIKYEK